MDLFMLFLTYAIIGWLWETVYCSLKAHHFVYRGFLLGPYCPVYGFGVLFVLLLVPKDAGTLLNLYFNMVVIVTVVEYITSWLLEKLFKMKLWDYSTLPLNIGGRVAVPVSLFWGIGCLFLLKVIQPAVAELVDSFIQATGGWGPVVLLILFVGDVVSTLIFTFTVKNDVAAATADSDQENANLKQYRLAHLFKNHEEDHTITAIRQYLEQQRSTLKRRNLRRLIKNFPNMKLRK